jgi:hypothetical protein
VTYLEEEGVLDFAFFLPYFVIRHVYFESLGKSNLLDEVLPLIAMVSTASLSNAKLSSLKFHSCPI